MMDHHALELSPVQFASAGIHASDPPGPSIAATDGVGLADMKVLGAAFGNPMGLRTFSGLACRLFSAIRDRGCLAGTLSTRQLRLRDALSGCYAISKGQRIYRPRLSRRWLWRPTTVATLSARFDRLLSRYPQTTAVLQVGTHVFTDKGRAPHFCITDLTVPQAAEARRFGFDRLSARELRGAIAAQQRIFDSCECIFVPTEWARQSIVSDLTQPLEKVHVVGEGASMDPVPFTDAKYVSKNILFVGYEWENKGGPLLFEAFKRAQARVPQATLTIIGCRPAIRHPGVEVLGPLRKNVPVEYARFKAAFERANCFCLLSELDAYGIVLLEAQLSGTPVIALDRGSRKEVVKSGRSGLLVRNAVPEEVAAALLAILLDPPLARAMGAAGHDFVSRRFTWSAVADRILQHIARTAIPLAA